VVGGQRLSHRLEDVALVEAGIGGDVAVQRRDPLRLRVDRDLEVAQAGHVVLAGLAGELLAGLVAQVVLGQHGVVDLDAGLLGQVAPMPARRFQLAATRAEVPSTVTTSPGCNCRPRRVSTSPLTSTSPEAIRILPSPPVSLRSASLRNCPSLIMSPSIATS